MLARREALKWMGLGIAGLVRKGDVPGQARDPEGQK